MDLNALVATIRHSPAAMFSIGVASAHADLILHGIVLGVFKVPLLRTWLMGHPQEALAKLDSFRDEVRKDILDLAPKAPAAPSDAPQPPAPPASA